MKDFTLSLAIVDFIPVFLSGLGLYFFTQWIKDETKVAQLGAILIFSGGLAKASWKLNVVLTGADIRILENFLFIGLGSGFILLAFALLRKLNQSEIDTPWKTPLTVLAIIAVAGIALESSFPDQRKWIILGIATATIANVIFSLRLSHFCWKNGYIFVSILIFLNLVGIFALSGIARIEGITLMQQWLAELTNLTTQSFFALGCYTLRTKGKSLLA